MSDPRRLLEDAPGTFARELMASAADDQPGPHAKERARAALAAGALGLSAIALQAAQSGVTAASSGVAPATASGAATGSGLGAVALTKWVGIATVAVAAGGGVTYWAGERVEPTPVASATVARTSLAPSAWLAPASVPAPLPQPASPVVPSSSSGALPPAKKSVAAPVDGVLSAEIAAMDAARHGLARGDRAPLERYLESYPRGAFREQALSLKIRALLRSGQDAQAKAEARAFLRAYPKSSEAPALRRLLGE